MSDVPPPPPPAGSNPPPPPPPPVGSTPLPPPPSPGLMAPPGYVGYTASPMSSVPLKRTAGVERAAVILVAFSAILSAGSWLVGRMSVSDAEDYLDRAIDANQFIEAIAPLLLLQTVESIATIASAVMVMIWMYRIAANHRTLHRGATWGPGWAIGGWFLPPLVLYVIPYLMLRELWRASDPDIAVGGEWRGRSVSRLTTVWFLLYGIAPIVFVALQAGNLTSALGTSEDDLAEQITELSWIDGLSAAVNVAAAVAFILLARQLGRRHRRLTGETSA